MAPEAEVGKVGDEVAGCELIVGEISDFGLVCGALGSFWFVCFIFRKAGVYRCDVGVLVVSLGGLVEVCVEHGGTGGRVLELGE